MNGGKIVVRDGKVLYYNIDTVAMKNTEKPSVYWTEEQNPYVESEFESGISKTEHNGKFLWFNEEDDSWIAYKKDGDEVVVYFTNENVKYKYVYKNPLKSVS